jgi:putative membrane protein
MAAAPQQSVALIMIGLDKPRLLFAARNRGEVSMIDRYSDHAANERTFLAWVRTGIATIVFGFVIEKFNLFVFTMAKANSLDAAGRAQLEKFSGSFSHYDGLALILAGIGIIALSLIRFVRITRLIDDPQTHSASSVRSELVLSVVLALIVATLTVHLAFAQSRPELGWPFIEQ